MSETAWNWIVWGGFGLGFFAREIPALFGRAPWLTLSDVLWGLEADWRPAAFLIILGCGWLLAHLAAHFVV